MDSARASRSRQMALFARSFFRYPKMIGSVVPSSRFLVERLLNQIDFSRARVIVEYGPGVGTFTGEILDRMRPNAVLIAIEMNPHFVQHLRETFQEPNLKVVHGSAADVNRILTVLGYGAADYIISGIPFTSLPEQARVAVMRESRAALKPNGSMLVYQFTRAVLPYLRREFGVVQHDFEPLNILPAQLFTCAKQAA